MQNLVNQRVGHFPYQNLPPVFTSLVGREREVRSACLLLLRSDIRLLTLTGTGGTGKTRLAIQIATELRSAFADGLCFVPLAPVSDPTGVIPAIARALELREELDSSLQEQVQDTLRDRDFLLLLDNFEQVVAAAPVLDDLLAACSRLRLLVTSRVELHLAYEQIFQVQPLSVPDLTALPTGEELAGVASIELFMQRARMVQPGFQLTQTNARTIATICACLDGSPLAIELAASRVNLLPPQALLKRLENRLSVLTSSAKSLPSRHQTMRNTIQWSYDLLSADEQRLFRRLSIFVDGFTIRTVETLHTGLEGSGESALDSLSSLIEKNLVRSPERDEEDPRPGMLETIRAFGLEVLEASGEYEAVQDAHMQYFLSLAEEASSHIPGQQEAGWNERLERELANLRAATQNALSYGKQTHNMEVALRLGSALKGFWTSRGYLREGRAFLEQALAACEGPVDAVRARAYFAAAHFAILACDYEQAQHMLEVCGTFYQEQNDTPQVARVIYRLGWVAHLQFQYARAHALYEEALALSRKLHDESMIDAVRYNLAYLAVSEGDYQQARVLWEESLIYRRRIDFSNGIAATLGDMAQLLRISSLSPPVEEMQRLLDEAIIYAREAGDRYLLMALSNGLAWVAFLRGDLDDAYRLVNEIITFYTEAGRLESLGHYLELLARIYAAQGKHEKAHATFEKSIMQAKKQNDLDTMSSDLIELTSLAVEQGQYARAARLLGADEKLRELASLPICPFDSRHRDQAITAANAILGQEKFALLWSEGRALSVMEALAANDAPPAKRTSASTRGKTYPAGLTRREVEVLRLVAQGLTDAQVAERLVVSPRTVSTHLTSIYNKLQVNTRASATNFAVKNHLV